MPREVKMLILPLLLSPMIAHCYGMEKDHSLEMISEDVINEYRATPLYQHQFTERFEALKTACQTYNQAEKKLDAETKAEDLIALQKNSAKYIAALITQLNARNKNNSTDDILAHTVANDCVKTIIDTLERPSLLDKIARKIEVTRPDPLRTPQHLVKTFLISLVTLISNLRNEINHGAGISTDRMLAEKVQKKKNKHTDTEKGKNKKTTKDMEKGKEKVSNACRLTDEEIAKLSCKIFEFIHQTSPTIASLWTIAQFINHILVRESIVQDDIAKIWQKINCVEQEVASNNTKLLTPANVQELFSSSSSTESNS